MLFNLNSAFLLALAATSVISSPVPDASAADTSEANVLVARAKVPAGGVDCKGQKFTSAQISAAVQQSRTQRGSFPKYFGNEGPNDQKVFPKAGPELYEFPILKGGGLYNGGNNQGIYRVVTNHNYVYTGVMVHGTGNSYTAC